MTRLAPWQALSAMALGDSVPVNQVWREGPATDVPWGISTLRMRDVHVSDKMNILHSYDRAFFQGLYSSLDFSFLRGTFSLHHHDYTRLRFADVRSSP